MLQVAFSYEIQLSDTLPDNTTRIIKSWTENTNTSCKQYDGSEGICRSTHTCVRQQPQQKLWNSCEWKEGHNSPLKVCCLSETQFISQLLKETDREQDVYVSDDDDSDNEHDNNRQDCGVSRVVSTALSFEPKNRRSKDILELYDMLFPTAYRIVMGNRVRVGQIPWMCAIYRHEQFVCGGSLIDDKHILTAAHCFEKNSIPAQFHIRFGSVMLYNGTVRRVEKIFVHDKYVPPRIYHDIAIVRSQRSIIFSDEVSPVCLPKMNWYNKKNLWDKTAFVSGFGDQSFGGTQASILQQTDLKIINNTYCETNYKNLVDNRIRYPVGMKSSVMCAGHEQGGKDACQGDSGGPLTTYVDGKAHLIGIVSFGYKCAQARFPGVYTFVNYYLNWIRLIMATD